jgi:hypothetical protein
MYPFHNDNN